jgi:hypothetical protein
VEPPEAPKYPISIDTIDEFIKTFEIEGKTVEWVLNHQKVWKYKLTTDYFERALNGFSFRFVYRKTFYIIKHERFDYRGDGLKCFQNGLYLHWYPHFEIDVTQWEPLNPGAKHWFSGQPSYTPESRAREGWAGPFATIGELLDKTGFGNKTLREIIDTEYDDGVVLCGLFVG